MQDSKFQALQFLLHVGGEANQTDLGNFIRKYLFHRVYFVSIYELVLGGFILALPILGMGGGVMYHLIVGNQVMIGGVLQAIPTNGITAAQLQVIFARSRHTRPRRGSVLAQAQAAQAQAAAANIAVAQAAPVQAAAANIAVAQAGQAQAAAANIAVVDADGTQDGGEAARAISP
jgi:predicted lipid-binding transport protein (Tim44 family)